MRRSPKGFCFFFFVESNDSVKSMCASRAPPTPTPPLIRVAKPKRLTQEKNDPFRRKKDQRFSKEKHLISSPHPSSQKPLRAPRAQDPLLG